MVSLAQFDVFRNPSKSSAKEIPFFVILQYDFLLSLPRIVVAPLRLEAKESPEMIKLNPRMEVDGRTYVIMIELLTSIDRRHIKSVHTSARAIS